jgi:hypothetical protein
VTTLQRSARGVDADRGDDHPSLALFAVMWALAAVWHLLGNTFVGSSWSQALLAAAVAFVLWRPGAMTPLSLLALASLVTVWEEAPVLGNHWLLVGLVDLVILMAVATAALRRRWDDPTDFADRVFPAARLCLLGFYGFAAFAKLNAGFFDRSTSCAVYYFGESTESVGLGALQLGGAAWLQWVVIVGTAAVELSIPVLLVVRRTRHVGVVLGLVFHGVLAIDRTHQFFDFSAVLAALFVLFLPSSAGEWVAERAGSVRARLALADDRLPRIAHVALAAAPAIAGLLVAADAVDASTALTIGWWPWHLYAIACVVATVLYLRQRRPTPERGALRPHHVLFLLVPLLVVANGLTPYLEVKTGYGWNMYANLRTVDGDSNHFLVRATLPLTDEQADLVRIISTDDPGLSRYADGGYALTWTQLRAYLADRPDVRITYARGDERVALRHASDRPELVEPVPVWREKLLLFRAVDLESPERCVPLFGPAR